MKIKTFITILLSIILASCSEINTPIQMNLITPTPLLSTPKPATTPIPTLKNDLKLRLVEELLINNKGCKLPCWWGVIPGKTKWQVAQNFLETFSKDIRSFKTSETDFLHRVTIPVPEKIFPMDVWQKYTDHDGIIETIEIFSGETTVYSLSNVLTDYGQPSEVWISWINNKPNQKGYLPIVIFLYYRNQRIIVQYSPSKLTVTKNTVIGCPQAEMFPKIFLWSPKFEIGKNFDEILNQTELEGKGLHLSVEKATGISIEKFYSTFKNANNSMCIETQFNLWPTGKEPFQ